MQWVKEWASKKTGYQICNINFHRIPKWYSSLDSRHRNMLNRCIIERFDDVKIKVRSPQYQALKAIHFQLLNYYQMWWILKTEWSQTWILYHHSNWDIWQNRCSVKNAWPSMGFGLIHSRLKILSLDNESSRWSIFLSK